MTTMRIQSPRGCAARAMTALTGALLLVALPFSPAEALSELPHENVPEQPSVTTVPLPPPIANPDNQGASSRDPASEDDDAAPSGEEAPVAPDSDAQPAAEDEAPEIVYDLSRLPEPVRALRDKLVAIAKAGDIEALRPLIGTGEDGTMLSFGEGNEDPIALLKGLSGDGEGHEILAILGEVLEAGFVHLEPGTDGEMYVWPYFFAIPIEGLTGPQLVELFRLVTAGDYEDMKNYGAYIFYRTGISPEGRWLFFVAGD